MKTGDILVIDKVEPLLDGDEEIGRVITDKAGDIVKVKKGQGGKLKDKWHLLDDNIGGAIKLTVGQFKDPNGKLWPFVSDFELVKNIFEIEAAAKIQGRAKEDRADSIEAQVAFKGAIELLVAKIINEDHPLAVAALAWAFDRLGESPMPQMISITPSSTPDKQQPKASSATLPTPDGKLQFKTAADLFIWATKHGLTLTKIKEKLGTSNPNEVKDLPEAIKILTADSPLVKEAKKIAEEG